MKTSPLRFAAMLTATALTAACYPPIDPPASTPEPASTLHYADFADQVTGAPMIVDVTVREARRIDISAATGLASQRDRFDVTATVNSLLRGSSAIPPEIRFLADVRQTAAGKSAKLRKNRFFIFARPVPGKPGQVQLSNPDSIILFTPEHDALVRGITQESVRIDAPPAITGLSQAFHVPGTITGEGETQIFLTTEKERPISISVLSRPGQTRSWSVSLGEVVDMNARAPARNTLLWYRLACQRMPRLLPEAALEGQDDAARAQAQSDYAFVWSALGPCPRANQGGA